jgi:hypothetical protein
MFLGGGIRTKLGTYSYYVTLKYECSSDFLIIILLRDLTIGMVILFLDNSPMTRPLNIKVILFLENKSTHLSYCEYLVQIPVVAIDGKRRMLRRINTSKRDKERERLLKEKEENK